MGREEATVEVLTAEVRVLKVGARQVTLSVYRQLDLVRPEDIEPFGRVQAREALGAIEIVGRRLKDGSLARGALADMRHGNSWDQELQKWKELPLIVLAGLK